MKGGNFDRKIDLQHKSVSQSNSGAPIETWSDLAAYIWAAYAPIQGDETFSTTQLAAKQQVEFQIRYSSDVADLNPLDRIVYPSVSQNSPPIIPDGSIYDILAVSEIGRREGLRIVAFRRADQ